MKRLYITVVVLLICAAAWAEPTNPKHHTYGRDPMVPGGITADKLKPGQRIVPLPYDVYFSMRGAHGEWASAWGRKGDLVVVESANVRTPAGEMVYADKVVIAQGCGNITVPVYIPAPAPPPAKPIIQKVPVLQPYPVDHWYQVELTTKTTERVPVPALGPERQPLPENKYAFWHQDSILRDVVRGAFLIGTSAARKPARITLNNNSESSSASAAAAAADATNINKDTNINIIKDTNTLNGEQQVTVGN